MSESTDDLDEFDDDPNITCAIINSHSHNDEDDCRRQLFGLQLNSFDLPEESGEGTHGVYTATWSWDTKEKRLLHMELYSTRWRQSDQKVNSEVMKIMDQLLGGLGGVVDDSDRRDLTDGDWLEWQKMCQDVIQVNVEIVHDSS